MRPSPVRRSHEQREATATAISIARTTSERGSALSDGARQVNEGTVGRGERCHGSPSKTRRFLRLLQHQPLQRGFEEVLHFDTTVTEQQPSSTEPTNQQWRAQLENGQF